LFASATHVLGWQGLTVTLPEEWNLAVFAGNNEKGNLRVDDGDGPRLELRWEQPKGSPDLERSIEQFLDHLEKDAKKRGQPSRRAKDPKLVQRSRKRKSQLVNFGWVGERSEEIIGQGWGLGWQCAECGRVVVAHLIGRGLENPGRTQRLAAAVLDTLECHGSGGWRTWGAFGLQLELPEEFQLGRAKLMTGRIDLEWFKAPPPPRAVGRCPPNALPCDAWRRLMSCWPTKLSRSGRNAPSPARASPINTTRRKRPLCAATKRCCCAGGLAT
jgi:hypothetical protein